MSIVQLADMKAQLNLTTTDDDVLVQAKIDGAENFIRNYVPAVYVYDPTAHTTVLAPTAPAVIEAIKLLAAHLYENREASLVGVTSADLPFGFWDLITPYRAWAF